MATKTYQQLQTELDAVMSQLQDDKLAVDESLELYEHATTLIEELRRKLKTAENKLNKIKV